MSDAFPTFAEVGEQNIRQRRQRLAHDERNWNNHFTRVIRDTEERIE